LRSRDRAGRRGPGQRWAHHPGQGLVGSLAYARAHEAELHVGARDGAVIDGEVAARTGSDPAVTDVESERCGTRGSVEDADDGGEWLRAVRRRLERNGDAIGGPRERHETRTRVAEPLAPVRNGQPSPCYGYDHEDSATSR
jgi:hypothetical protein